MKKAALALTVAALALPAAAAPVPPTKSVPASFYSGRWYEVARTPNIQQRDCEAPTYQFAPKTSDTLAFTMTCHKGEPDGKPRTLKVTLRLPSDQARNRFRCTAMGGLASVNYYVLDRADDGAWWILETSKSGKVWLLARTPKISGEDRSEAMASLKAKGIDPSTLEFPKQA